MLNDLKDFEHIYIACGHTDLRYGIDGLAGVIRERFELDPYTGRTVGHEKDQICRCQKKRAEEDPPRRYRLFRPRRHGRGPGSHGIT